jgi:hypothetical protein
MDNSPFVSQQSLAKQPAAKKLQGNNILQRTYTPAQRMANAGKIRQYTPNRPQVTPMGSISAGPVNQNAMQNARNQYQQRQGFSGGLGQGTPTMGIPERQNTGATPNTATGSAAGDFLAKLQQQYGNAGNGAMPNSQRNPNMQNSLRIQQFRSR